MITEMLIAVFVLLIVFFWSLHLYLCSRPEYEAAKRIPGAKIYPIIGDMIEVMQLKSAEASLNHALLMARTIRRAYRFYLFGTIHYWPIRAHEIEVSYSNLSLWSAMKILIYSL